MTKPIWKPAGALANLMQKSSDKLDQQITFGFRRVLTRPPNPEELKRLNELYHQLKPEFLQPNRLSILRPSSRREILP